MFPNYPNNPGFQGNSQGPPQPNGFNRQQSNIPPQYQQNSGLNQYSNQRHSLNPVPFPGQQMGQPMGQPVRHSSFNHNQMPMYPNQNPMMSQPPQMSGPCMGYPPQMPGQGMGYPPQMPGQGMGCPPQMPGQGMGCPPQMPGQGMGCPPQMPGPGMGCPPQMPGPVMGMFYFWDFVN